MIVGGSFPPTSKRRRVTNLYSSDMDTEAAKAQLAAMKERFGREIHVFETSSLSPSSNAASSNGEETDDFYEFTAEDYHRLMATKKEDKFLKTQKIREAEEASRRSRITKAVIRVLFADNHTLEASFNPSETVQSLIDLLTKVIAQPEQPFHIYTTPPKKLITNMSQDCYTAGFCPGAIVYLSYNVPKGRPPPAASMAVGQFFNPEEGNKYLSPWFMLQSTYSQKELLLEEAHPLAVKLSFAMSLGLLPVTLSLKTFSCGIRNSGLPEEEAGELESSRLCELRCFPPVALAWDDISGLHIYPNLNSETIFVDSSPAQWSSTQQFEKTIVLLLVDPHCSYKSSISISISAAASRLLLLYSSKIVGFSIAVVFFALMQEAYYWDLDLWIPSMLTAVESNLTLMSHLFPLAVLPILFSLFLSLLMSQPFPPFASFISISLICYIFANGFIAILILVSHLVFFVAAVTHFHQDKVANVGTKFSLYISLLVVMVLRANSVLVTSLTAMVLACLVHPSFGLLILLFSHFFCCHNALCSEGYKGSERLKFKFDGSFNRTFPSDDNFSNSPDSSKSFGETQLDVFHHRHGLLILHLLATMMFAPSVVAWFQRLAMGESIPWLLDSVLCIGVILHGICNSKPEFNSFFLSFTGAPIRNVRLYFVYLIAGYWSYFSGLALAPYRGFCVMAAVGGISFALRMFHRRNREKKEVNYDSRKHSHRH